MLDGNRGQNHPLWRCGPRDPLECLGRGCDGRAEWVPIPTRHSGSVFLQVRGLLCKSSTNIIIVQSLLGDGLASPTTSVQPPLGILPYNVP